MQVQRISNNNYNPQFGAFLNLGSVKKVAPKVSDEFLHEFTVDTKTIDRFYSKSPYYRDELSIVHLKNGEAYEVAMRPDNIHSEIKSAERESASKKCGK